MDEWKIIVDKDECKYRSCFIGEGKTVMVCTIDNDNMECTSNNCPIIVIPME